MVVDEVAPFMSGNELAVARGGSGFVVDPVAVPMS
jgi:hypothetical protein